MSLKYSLVEENKKSREVTYKLHTSDQTEANLARTSIMKNIECERVVYITYDINESLFNDEKIAMRVGLCPIIQEDIIIKDKYYFDLETKAGKTRWFTTEDIEDIPFFGTHKLSFLQEKSRLKGYVELRKGTAVDYSPWMVTTIPVCVPVEKHFEISFVNNGIYSNDYIMKTGLKMMKYEIMQAPVNDFQKPIYSKKCFEKYS